MFELLKNSVVGFALLAFVLLTLGPVLWRASRALARQGVFFALICCGFLVSMASKPTPPTPPTPTTTYTVTFDLAGHGTRTGGGELVQTVEKGAAAVAPTVKASAGYEFVKWDKPFSSVTQDMTVTAQYRLTTYKIAYANLMGASNPNPTTFTVEDELTFAAPSAVEGYSFVGWTPSGIARGTTGNVTATANWTIQPGPGPEPTPEDSFEFKLEDGPITPFVLSVRSVGFKSLKLKGLPSGLTSYNESVVIDGEASVLVFVKGTPKKAGVTRATLTETWPDGTTVTKTYTFVIRSDAGDIVNAVWDYDCGKVTGPGELKDNGKVTLKATANKGFVFSGWWDVTNPGESNFVTRLATLVVDRSGKAKDTATQKVVWAEDGDRLYRAEFITALEDAMNISATVGDCTFVVDERERQKRTVTAGVGLSWQVTAEALSATTIKVSGLPSGLAYKNGVISGYPTKASSVGRPSEVKIVVTTAGKNKATFVLSLTVEPLPDWAVGSFAGVSYEEAGGETTNGLVTATVASTGKITAKQPVGGKNVSFSAKGYDTYDREAGILRATLTAKVAGEVVKNEVAATANGAFGRLQATLFDAWGYDWKSEPWKSEAADFKGRVVEYETDDPDGTVTATFAANGTAKVAGTFLTGEMKGEKPVTVKASGSTTLLPMDDGTYRVFIYLAPKGLSPHARCLDLVK